MKLIVIICMVAVMCDADEKIINLCGRPLSEARVLLCFGAQYVNKRDSDPLMLSDSNENNIEEDWPWTGRRGALSASWSRLKRQGIVNECCYKPCKVSEMLNYC